MKLFARNLASVIFAMLFAQLFFSCSTSRVQSAKNNYLSNELAIAQVNQPRANKAEPINETTNVESTENTNNIALASAEKEQVLINTKKSSLSGTFKSAKKTLVENSISKTELKRKYFAEPLKSPLQDKPKGKNQWIALVLAFILGTYGAHRFYLGRTRSAIFQLTLIILALVSFIAAFIFIPLEAPVLFLALYALGFILAIINFIWVVIDIVNILTGSLKPKDGEYTEAIDL